MKGAGNCYYLLNIDIYFEIEQNQLGPELYNPYNFQQAQDSNREELNQDRDFEKQDPMENFTFKIYGKNLTTQKNL